MTIEVDLKGGELSVMAYTIGSINPTRLVPEEFISFPVSNLPTGLRTALKGQMVSKDVLRPINQARAELENFLETCALKTAFGYVINPRKAGEVARFVDEICTRVNDYKDEFIAKYPEECERVDDDIREQYSDFAHVDEVVRAIQRCRPDVSYLERQLGMTHVFGRISTLEDVDPKIDGILTTGNEMLRKGLWGQLLSKVTTKADKILFDVQCRQRDGSDQVSQKTVKRFKKVLEMLDNMAFIDGRVPKLKALLIQAMATLPCTGPLRGREATDFCSILHACSDPSHIGFCIEQDVNLLTIKGEEHSNPVVFADNSPEEKQEALALFAI